MKLIPMVDYSLMPIVQKLSVGELNVYSASTLRKLEREYMRNYAKLLREPLKFEHFVGLPVPFGQVEHKELSPIFDGWAYRSEHPDIGIFFCGHKEILFRKDSGRFYKPDAQTEISTIEDLMDYELTLNENGVNRIKKRS